MPRIAVMELFAVSQAWESKRGVFLTSEMAEWLNG